MLHGLCLLAICDRMAFRLDEAVTLHQKFTFNLIERRGGEDMNMAILGGGNIGTLMAGEFAVAGHRVRLFTSTPECWNGPIDVLNHDGNLLMRGTLDLVTDNVAKAVEDADIIWITYPIFMLQNIADLLLPLVDAGQKIGVVPGACAEFFFSEHKKKGCVLFGLQRVHSVARLDKRGKSVYALGNRRAELQVAALPRAATADAARLVNALFDISTVPLPNYLTVTLTPSNPILHTSRIRSMFLHWHPGIAYDRNILFYGEWDIASAELLLACDEEVQKLCHRIELECGLDLKGVKSLRIHYESNDAKSLARKISSIPALKGLASPMRQEKPGVWVPDFNSRYFKADFLYGLKAMCDIAALVGMDTPNLSATYNWYLEVSGAVTAFALPQQSLSELTGLYN